MNLHVINTGNFKLDGGAMFGVVPKSIWNKLQPADENNLCTWAMRCLLVSSEDRLVLIDTGIGNKQDQKFFSHYYLQGQETLEKSINIAGFSLKEVTDVILTHLHFDHVGGAVSREGDNLKTTFSNATYWSNEFHWAWATENPNPREKASFLSENILPIIDSGQLEFINPNGNSPFAKISFICVDGHTEKQMLPVIEYKDQKILFAADLIPSSSHISLAYTMAYDVRPLLSMQEKAEVLEIAAKENYILFFEHDPIYEAATVIKNDKGFKIDQKGALKDFI